MGDVLNAQEPLVYRTQQTGASQWVDVEVR